MRTQSKNSDWQPELYEILLEISKKDITYAEMKTKRSRLSELIDKIEDMELKEVITDLSIQSELYSDDLPEAIKKAMLNGQLVKCGLFCNILLHIINAGDESSKWAVKRGFLMASPLGSNQNRVGHQVGLLAFALLQGSRKGNLKQIKPICKSICAILNWIMKECVEKWEKEKLVWNMARPVNFFNHSCKRWEQVEVVCLLALAFNFAREAGINDKEKYSKKDVAEVLINFMKIAASTTKLPDSRAKAIASRSRDMLCKVLITAPEETGDDAETLMEPLKMAIETKDGKPTNTLSKIFHSSTSAVESIEKRIENKNNDSKEKKSNSTGFLRFFTFGKGSSRENLKETKSTETEFELK